MHVCMKRNVDIVRRRCGECMERWFERNMGRGLKTDSDGEATTEMVKIGASRVIIVVYYTT